MKAYEINDRELNQNIGVLLYFEKKKEFVIELQDYLDKWTAPLLFARLVEDGIYTVPRDLSLLWVKERIIPAGRQNINEILSTHGLRQYDEMKFLELSRGECSQDHMYIRALDELPDFVKKRNERNLIECVICEDFSVLCAFADNSLKKFELERFLDRMDDINKVLNNRQVFLSGEVGTGGYSLTFNDSIDVPAKFIYENGENLPITLTDILTFARRNIMDTTECCQMLECSRQNLSYMVKKNQLSPIKEEVKGNLYLRGEVIKNMW